MYNKGCQSTFSCEGAHWRSGRRPIQFCSKAKLDWKQTLANSNLEMERLRGILFPMAELKVRPAQRVLQEPPDPRDIQVLWGLDRQVLQVKQALLDIRVPWALDRQVLQVKQAQQVLLDIQVPWAQVQLDQQARQVPLDGRVPQEPRDLRVTLELRALRVLQAGLDLLGQQVPQGGLDLLGQQVLLGGREPLDPQEIPVL